MQEFDTFIATGFRPLGDDRRIRAKYGMHYIKGNKRPYFSITADIQDKLANGRWYDSGGGCCHDEIAEAFPELADLIPWHLCDDDGSPMYYIANAIYWAELEARVSRWQKGPHYLHGKTFLDVLKSHVLADVLGDAEELATHAAEFRNLIPLSAERIVGGFTQWLEGRKGRLKEVFAATMAKHRVAMICLTADATAEAMSGV